MTYVIIRNNRRYGNKQFSAYEPARNYVRKLVRTAKVSTLDPVVTNQFENRVAQNNLPISAYGFSVKRRPCSVKA